MYKYRIIGLALIIIPILSFYYKFFDIVKSFVTYDLYSIGFLLLLIFIPLEMILINNTSLLFRSKDELYELKWRLRAEGKQFYKSSIIMYLDYILLFLIVISFLIMFIGMISNLIMTGSGLLTT
jgi:hypothetical protein